MKASILLPTTADRGPLLQYSAGSALRQSVQEIELLIVGDGVDESTRLAANSLVQQDERVRFFDYPKDSRRGEVYRHEVLQKEAKGDIVCYLCDRDLLLSNHVAELYEGLKTCDIASTLSYSIRGNGEITLAPVNAVGELTENDRALRRLTCVAHTLESYRSLPYGWRTTPPDQFTDVYMWNQFLDQRETRARVIPAPTVLYFKRGAHPGWPTEDRRLELANWYATLIAEGGESRIHQYCLYHILQILTDFRTDVLRQNRKNVNLRKLLRRTARRLRRFVSGFSGRGN